MRGNGNRPAQFPDVNEVAMLMAGLLPPAQEGFGSVPDGFKDTLTLSGVELVNKSIKTQIWFAFIQNLDSAFTRSVVDRYKKLRGSLAMLTKGTIGTSRTDGADRVINTGGNNIPPVVLAVPPSGGVEVESMTYRASTKLPTAPELAPTSAYDTRKASYVNQYFRDAGFTGELSQSIDLTIRDYEVCARQYKLSAEQKANYFVNALKGPARTFFIAHHTPGFSFEDIIKMMMGEYNSNSRQLQVQSVLETLKLKTFMTEKEVSSLSVGLTKLVDHIERLSPQCPPGFRGDSHKIRHLRSAMINCSWARSPISNIISNGYSFNAFRYGKNPRNVRRHNYGERNPSRQLLNNRESNRTFEYARRRSERFRCAQPWKPGHRCAPGSITQNEWSENWTMGARSQKTKTEERRTHFADSDPLDIFYTGLASHSADAGDDSLASELDEAIATNLISSAANASSDFR
eukprot:IDg20181t1